MSSSFILYLAIIAAFSLVGGMLPLLRNWSNRRLLLSISFSCAGYLLVF